MTEIINLDDPNVWLYACDQWTILFQHVMLMIMENPTVTQAK